MLVRLKQHVVEGGGIKMAVKANKDWTPPKAVDGKVVECGLPEKKIVAYTKDAVIEMSDASAKKYIEKGLAEPCIPEENKKK